MHDETSKWQASVFAKRKGNAYATEEQRSATSEETLMENTQRNVRYSQGGIHERLKQAAKAMSTNANGQPAKWAYDMKRCLIGINRCLKDGTRYEA